MPLRLAKAFIVTNGVLIFLFLIISALFIVIIVKRK
jgi:hypothetical protein